VHVENLTRALRGVEPVVIAPRVCADDPAAESRAGIPVRRFASSTGGKRLKEIAKPSPLVLGAYAAACLAAVLEDVRTRSSEMILCHWVLPSGPPAAAAAVLLGVPLVLVAHGSDVNRYARGALGLAARAACAAARRVVAVSEPLRATLVQRLGVARERTAVVPMGVGEPFTTQLPARREAREALALAADDRVVFFAGDLVPEKGVPELLEAWETLARRAIRVKLVLGGGGPLREPAGRVRGPSQAVFLGPIPQVELARWYRAADLFVLPSRSEGSPVTVMEALACGLPVVASRVGGIPDLVEDGATGWLVPPGDADALAAALEGALRSPEALAKARARLAETPRDFGAPARARELRAILEEARRVDGC
jgi:glycosyltransferase involved in cell wall biosynthesis